ncbi:MAG: exodeoxyribonuclease VII large subunit [Bacillota bacterium]|nr:exodeoxyribonuclease VII large subunit [Bacillota bacterium]
MEFCLVKVFSVAELNSLIKFQLESNIVLKSFVVSGEVSSVTHQRASNATGKRTWFTLIGAGSEISCVSWEGCEIKQGDAVEIKGKIEVWNNKGQYKLNAIQVKQIGEGAAKEALARLTAELEKKGYFDPRNKKMLPPCIKKVALVTSQDGAAVGDVLETLLTRGSIAAVRIYDVRVQGTGAPAEIASAIDEINFSADEVDVILLTRGGGGTADLAVFNDPLCFEAVHNSRIPVICAIGHERDESLSERCADVQCITPTKAATIIADHSSRTMYYLQAVNQFIKISDLVHSQVLNLEKRLSSVTIMSPYDRLRDRELRLSELRSGMMKNVENGIKHKMNALENTSLRIEASSPFSILDKGYGLVYKNEKVAELTSTERGDRISILMKDGTILAKVEEVRHEDIRTKI